MVSEAQKKAKAKYDKEHYKMWNCRLKPEDFKKIEAERTSRNLSRKEFLELLSKKK